MRGDFAQRGKPGLHDALAPLLGSGPPDGAIISDTATRLSMTENAVRIALTRMRRDFRDHLLIEVKQTLDEGEDARAEIRYLLGFFEPS